MSVIKLVFIIFGFFTMTGLILTGCESSYGLLYRKSSYSSDAVFQIPQTNFEIVLERRAAHLFLAEYERTIVLRADEKEFFRQEAAFDTGGYCRMNIYQISPTEYFLSGDVSFDKHKLDVLQKRLNSNSLLEKPLSAKFIGTFDIDEKQTWRFIPANEREEQKSKINNSIIAEKAIN